MYSAIWVYPWDLLDEGFDTALARIADAGLGGVSLAVAYHSVRALCPHNPHHAVIHGEGNVVYFQPNPDSFVETRLKPTPSSLLADGDVLERTCEAAARRGLKVHAWTVLHHNSRLGTAFPDCTIENAFGDRYPFGLCPANPEVRAYTLGLVQSLSRRENLGVIELESLGYMGMEHTGLHSKQGVELDTMHRFLLSLCFCEYCQARMRANDVDTRAAREAAMREIRGYLSGLYQPNEDDPLGQLAAVLGKDQADGILAARDEVVLSLLEELYWQVNEPQQLSVMVASLPLITGAGAAVTLSEAREWCDILLTQVFLNSVEAIHEAVADVAVRRGSVPVYAGLQAIAPFVHSKEELTQRVKTVREAGADGVQFYHYGLMPLRNLEWITEALAVD
ncbi:MAG TPA: hypothetical protein VNJ09_05570 [Chthonomonadales bacterium]|nr:hypothetical protein [Chthonomonadales bacterium]